MDAPNLWHVCDMSIFESPWRKLGSKIVGGALLTLQQKVRFQVVFSGWSSSVWCCGCVGDGHVTKSNEPRTGWDRSVKTEGSRLIVLSSWETFRLSCHWYLLLWSHAAFNTYNTSNMCVETSTAWNFVCLPSTCCFLVQLTDWAQLSNGKMEINGLCLIKSSGN